MSVLDKNHTVGEKNLQHGDRTSRREFLKKLSILPVACPTDKPLGRRAAMASEKVGSALIYHSVLRTSIRWNRACWAKIRQIMLNNPSRHGAVCKTDLATY